MANMSEQGESAERHPLWARLFRSALRIAAVFAVLLVIGWATGCMERFFYIPTSEPTPLPDEYLNAEAVDFESADGTKLHGWFIPARTGAGHFSDLHQRNAATIIHAHGNAVNISNHRHFSDFLLPAGFNLFIFDYRGYGQSDGRARKRDDLIADTEAALIHVLSRDDVDPNRIGLYGQSLGGSIGLHVMLKRSEIRCAVIESAFTSWRDIAADVIGGWTISRMLAAMLIPDHRRVDEAVAQIDRPLLFIHGTGDRTIPVHHGRRLAEAAGDNASLLELPGGDHNDLHLTHPQVEQETIEFFSKHLPPRDESADNP